MKYTILFFILSAFVFAENPVKKIYGQYTAADVDINGNVYAVDKQLNFIKIKHDSITARMYSIANYGDNPLIDASNPLEIFIYFGSTGNMLVMDNLLNIQMTLNLYQSRFIQPIGFGRANDGNIWILDNNSTTLKKLDKQGNVLLESVQIKELAPSASVRRIYDNGQYIFTHDGNGYVRIFNQNLVMISNYEADGIVGLSTDQYFYKKGQQVFATTIGTETYNNTDTVYTSTDSTQIIQANTRHILSFSPGGLTLQHR